MGEARSPRAVLYSRLAFYCADNPIVIATAHRPRILKRVLVTGAAGYIGSHLTRQLISAGHYAVALDDLSAGRPGALPAESAAFHFVEGSIADRALVANIIREHRIDALIHLAAHVQVAESVAQPGKYHRNNVAGSLNLLQACIDAGVACAVFSSSAAVYGVAGRSPVAETDATWPINPYGAGKLMVEWMLRDFANVAGKFRFVALRYFNVAGASGDLGPVAAPGEATHLIKVACEAAVGARRGMAIFGDDYPTADGTCVRDYIHVADLAAAHLCALEYLDGGGMSATLNCGYGRGSSVAQVIACVKAVSGADFPVTVGARRPGDPPELVADNAAIRRAFNWSPRFDDLETICRSAWEWERRLNAAPPLNELRG